MSFSLTAPLLGLLFAGASSDSWATDAALRSACNAPAVQQALQAEPAGAGLEARAVWLNRQLIRWPGISSGARFRLYHSALGQIVARGGSAVAGADGLLELDVFNGSMPDSLKTRFAWTGSGIELRIKDSDLGRLDDLFRGQWVLVLEGSDGRVQASTRLQIAGALDDLYAAAGQLKTLGAIPRPGRSSITLWAPTARAVHVCLFDDDRSDASEVLRMHRSASTGAWTSKQSRDLRGHYYSYLVDVLVPGHGLVRNRVTDPYALSLGADSRRVFIADLNDPALQPEGWDRSVSPDRVKSSTDMVIYELHVRDFSINDPSVSETRRGKYGAFSENNSNGMRHLRALAQAGMTDVHLLPVFDLATVPEQNCITPTPSGGADSESQQAAVQAVKSQDCFNWGYDPLHYTAPEGSYASDASDGARRIVEFRQMVMGLHQAGLRVGMDVVYNHTSAAGQDPKSVLDRIVPGYYQRLNARGEVETSTCCSNTATENAMMAKLMIDSTVVWARDYRIDSFRFDLMGHQPREAMLQLQQAVNNARGREVQLIGEGWNFGEVADGKRFVQASQLSLNGSGIGTFSDRARDAVRGGGCCDSDHALVTAQGVVNGLHYAPNAQSTGRASRNDLLQAMDLVRVGLAGSIRDYRLTTFDDRSVTLEQIPYAGNQPAGYVSQPGEVVNYVENHDNQTLFDINALKLPQNTSREDRARVQMLAAAVTIFSQGIAYFHAGIDTLRSKSMDRNSYDSGDWFNRLDWSYQDNYFGIGLPLASDNQASWPLMRPRLADPAIKPLSANIVWTRDAFRDLLRIRASSSLFRLRTAEDIKQRLRLLNTGSDQVAGLLVGQLKGDGYPGARFRELLYFINVDTRAHELQVAQLAGTALRLHPVHRAETAADSRPLTEAEYHADSGRFRIPARTAVVFVAD